jgi:hypothetical protein
MEKNHSLSRQQRLLTNERWEPYIKWDKETDEWVYKAIRVDSYKDEEMEEDESKIEMTRKELDIISRIVAYLYHDKKDEYEEIASEMRKNHIYADLRSINIWLDSQYRQLEGKNEQSKQKKRKYL